LETEEAVQKALQWNSKETLKGQVMYIERSTVGKSKTQTPKPKEDTAKSDPMVVSQPSDTPKYVLGIS
jgi:hypothetical protein